MGSSRVTREQAWTERGKTIRYTVVFSHLQAFVWPFFWKGTSVSRGT